MKYTFRGTSDGQDRFCYKEDEKLYKYYQVCTFMNPHTEKYRVRRFVVNGKGQFVNIQERDYTEREYQMFLKHKKPNEYKLFSTYDLNYVNYPTAGDLQIAQSPILSNDADYTGYSMF